MNKIVIDTNILIYHQNKTVPWAQKISSIFHSYDVCLSTISLTEIRAGWSKELYIQKKADLHYTCTFIPINEDIALTAGAIRYECQKLGKKIPALDAIIAATAITTKLPLLTNNTSDFQNIPDLQLFSLDSFQPTALQ